MLGSDWSTSWVTGVRMRSTMFTRDQLGIHVSFARSFRRRPAVKGSCGPLKNRELRGRFFCSLGLVEVKYIDRISQIPGNMGTFVVYLFCASVIFVTQRSIAAVQRDYYKVLGLAREATDREVREVFRRLALRYHPDKDASPEAERRFLEIQQAFEVLSDPIRRGMHDLKLGLGERRRVAHGSGVLPSLDDLHAVYDAAAGDSQPDFDSGDVATGFYVTVEHVTGFEPPPDRLLRPRAAVRLREHDQWREDAGAITCTTFMVDDGDNLSQVKHTRCR